MPRNIKRKQYEMKTRLLSHFLRGRRSAHGGHDVTSTGENSHPLMAPRPRSLLLQVPIVGIDGRALRPAVRHRKYGTSSWTDAEHAAILWSCQVLASSVPGFQLGRASAASQPARRRLVAVHRYVIGRPPTGVYLLRTQANLFISRRCPHVVALCTTVALKSRATTNQFFLRFHTCTVVFMKTGRVVCWTRE
jgi:hypothetical protein